MENLKIKELFIDKKVEKSIPSLLLHSCCAPCSTSVIERLLPLYNITIYYYNPNIYPQEEYLKRLSEQKRLLAELNIPFLEGDFDIFDYEQAISGYENQKEGEARCYKCYELRMQKTCAKAIALGFDYFGTTLTVSPRKNAIWVNEIGQKLQNNQIKYLIADFKKQDGYKRSIELSKKHNLYRQHYCGCKASLPHHEN